MFGFQKIHSPFWPHLLRSDVHFQASEDAKKLVDEERSFARAEIENAREAVRRVEEALEEQERIARASGKQVCAICLTILFCTSIYLFLFSLFYILEC